MDRTGYVRNETAAVCCKMEICQFIAKLIRRFSSENIPIDGIKRMFVEKPPMED